MDDMTVQVIVGHVSDVERDHFTGELQAAVVDSHPDVTVSRLTTGGTTQDAGTILQIILNAGAMIALAKGIADWLRLRNGAEVKLKCKDGTEVLAKSVTDSTAEKVILEALKKCQERQAKKK